MTYRETINWLNRARRIEDEIDEVKERYQRAVDAATRQTPNYSTDPASPSSDFHGKMDSVAEYADVLEKYRQAVAAIKVEVTQAIMKLEDSDERRMLSFRFLDMMTMYEISERTNYSRQQCWRIISNGVNSISNMLHDVT